MVDFKKRLKKGAKARRPLDPVALYDTLDRASDKGPLRPAQKRLLRDWHDNRRSERDLILKLHTGQGKTLLGLLMLQAKLNEDAGPALYLCPNHFLVNQTCEQARQFGVPFVTVEDRELPESFVDGSAILITVVQKLFNGLTKFGLGAKSVPVGSIVVDDAHACIDHIRDQFVIRISHDVSDESTAFSEIVSLFERELREQGDGTFEDISRHEFSAYLPVPYWAWWDRTSEVAGILSRHQRTNALRFQWPLLKDSLRYCQCLVTGKSVIISPYRAPVEHFGSYDRARHRVFMSATVTDDSFLVKGLGLSPGAVKAPLVDATETWSGEKMILIPPLIDRDLQRGNIVERFAKDDKARTHGVVVLVPSAKRCADWGKYGATVVDKNSIEAAVEDLRSGNYKSTVVIANYYDGVDLPDDSCRVLVIDSKPFADDFLERYVEERRQNSQLVAGRIARIVEQGMGRAVRGEKDYCVIILIGPDLIRALRAPGQRGFFSDQTRTQIEIGQEIAEMAREEIADGTDPFKALLSTINQCLRRDPDWKEFYVQRMDDMTRTSSPHQDAMLKLFEHELSAERHFEDGQWDRAAQAIQGLMDEVKMDASERGWYLQEKARYLYASSKTRSNELQVAAHQANRSLLRPSEGMTVTTVETPTPQARLERLRAWLRAHESAEDLATDVDSILSDLVFGVDSNVFEAAFDHLAGALGFPSDRPDHDWKEGPDNLWGLRDGQYLLVECKNMVSLERADITKREADQVNRASDWFARHYEGATATRIIIHPTHNVHSAGGFRDDVSAMRKRELEKLVKNVRAFFAEFYHVDLKDISTRAIERSLHAHELTVEDLCTKYAKKVRQLPSA